MKNTSNIIVGVIFVLLAVVSAFVASLFWFTRDLCGNEIYAEYPSPNHAYKAVIFQRDCGATTAYSTQISIIDATSTLRNKKGNIYIIDGQPEELVLSLQWLSEEQLLINRPLNGLEYRAKTQFGWWNKIDIQYSEDDRE